MSENRLQHFCLLRSGNPGNKAGRGQCTAQTRRTVISREAQQTWFTAKQKRFPGICDRRTQRLFQQPLFMNPRLTQLHVKFRGVAFRHLAVIVPVHMDSIFARVFCICTSFLHLHVFSPFARVFCICVWILYLHVFSAFAHVFCFCTCFLHLHVLPAFARFFLHLHIGPCTPLYETLLFTRHQRISKLPLEAHLFHTV